jgi:SAM-dependent methyltransferase
VQARDVVARGSLTGHPNMLMRQLRVFVGNARCRYYDWRHRVRTCGDVALTGLEISGDNLDHAVYYAPSHPHFIRCALADLRIEYSAYDFVDLGSGKGRVLLVASEFPFRQIIGIEFARELHDIATKNIARYVGRAQRCRDISSIHADAVEYQFADRPTVVFMFNPFRPAVLVPVLRNLQESIDQYRRDVILLYASPFHDRVVEEETELRLVSRQAYHNVYRAPADNMGGPWKSNDLSDPDRPQSSMT